MVTAAREAGRGRGWGKTQPDCIAKIHKGLCATLHAYSQGGGLFRVYSEIRERKQTTTATATETSPNKTFNVQNNS